ncbi:MAG: dihydrolipoyl dehydrogenase [Muribaculum sp.]|nr:dihydrolipoyl dehydrogenase [Muribaculaceae bacterium]MCM1080875.1 dihydrolipoyl dehydrogenase [Muribaculum sp.]
MISADVIIIGCGPAGMEMCARSLAMAKSVVVVESDQLGGTCLNKGCIPTKALCKSAEVVETIKEAAKYGVSVENVVPSFAAAVERKDNVVAQMRQNVEAMLSKATIVHGEAVVKSVNVVEVNGEQYTAPMIVVASGSEPAFLNIEGTDLCIDSTAMLDTKNLPQRICIVGGGVIGMEFACILNSYGVEVTVVEFCPEILPNFDKEVAKRLRSLISRKGIKVLTSAAVTAVKPGFEVFYTQKGKELSIEADCVLMAVGRKPAIPKGLEEIGVKVGRRGIEVDENYATSIPGIYAIGDVNGKLMLAHAAEAQARVVCGEKVDLNVVPADVFTEPECAMVGLTQEQCADKDVKITKSLFRANGKANAMGETDGFVKLITESATGKILGCHIIGPHASDLVQEVANAMASGQTAADIASVIHAHPTLSETVSAACRAAE